MPVQNNDFCQATKPASVRGKIPRSSGKRGAAVATRAAPCKLFAFAQTHGNVIHLHFMAAVTGFAGLSESLDMFSGFVEGKLRRNPLYFMGNVMGSRSFHPRPMHRYLGHFGNSDKCQWPFKKQKDSFPMPLTIHLLYLSISFLPSLFLSIVLSFYLSFYLVYPSYLI